MDCALLHYGKFKFNAFETEHIMKSYSSIKPLHIHFSGNIYPYLRREHLWSLALPGYGSGGNRPAASGVTT